MIKETCEILGSVLVKDGLSVTVPNQYQSKILIYQRKN